MQGTILSFDVANNKGMISCEDGNRYRFALVDWGGADAPYKGTAVEFSLREDGQAKDIKKSDAIPIAAAQAKSRIVAALQALFLGGLGIHKFYIGDHVAGAIMLMVSLLGLALLGIPSALVGLIALVEFELYLTKSDADFERIYLQEKRAWL